MSTTLVHLLRHGKVHNPGNILYGRLPGYRLAASGREMAAGVAGYLGRTGTDIAYLAASSLQRAQETAAPLAELTGLPVQTDDRIIEAANDFEGTAVGAHTFRSPGTWLKLRDPLRPSWGEPYLEIAHRMLGAVYTAVHAADGRAAVLVSHQLPIVTVRRYLEGRRLWHDPRRRQCAVASLTTLTFVDGVFAGLGYAEPVGHIAAVDDPDAGPDVEQLAPPHPQAEAS